MRIIFLSFVAFTFFTFLFFSTPATAAGIIDLDDEESIFGDPDEWLEQIMELIEQIAAMEDDDGEALFVDNPSSQEAKTILAKLKNQKVTFHFQDTSFDEVINFLRDVTGVNFVVSNDAAEIIEASGRTITLRLKDVRLETAMKLVLEGFDELGYAIKDGVLYIGLKEKLRTRRLYIAFYEIGELVTKPPDFPAPKMALRDEGGTQINYGR
ncbi:MAG: hypothetical protein E3J72_15585 [Planctomycetota bacterium]|nr:MAG: hypothetical protein E3J72_15585 [Planctomycetota bacterium]